jgi:hypothetical protein
MRNCFVCAGFIAALITACGPSGTVSPDAGDTNPDPPDADTTPTCNDGATQCLGTAEYQTCVNGEWQTSETCVSPQICATSQGCVDCVPNQDYCVGNSVHTCSPEGADGGEKEACESPLQCSGGECKDLCEDAAENRSYIGCEYWAVDLPNALQVEALANGGSPCATGTKVTVDVCVNGSEHEGLCEPDGSCPGGTATCENREVCAFNAHGAPFAIVVSNPQTFSVDVTISIQDGTTQTVSVAAGAVEKFFPQDIGFPDQSVVNTTLEARAYKIESTAPVVAYQFNPLNNEDVFSNDGSLLIPRTTFDVRYYGMTWPTINRRYPALGGPGANDWHGYVTIVAWEDGTEIQVTPAGNVKAGPTMPAIAAGTPTTFTLNAFEVLNIAGDNTQAAPEQDLTGTLVEGTNGKTFGVFAGNEAIGIIADGASCCADHIEEMMFPTSTWGTDFRIARSKIRRGEPDWIRVMAQEDGTTITFNPAPMAGSCGTLNAGAFCEVQINVDTEISANDKPILIGHYLASTIVPSPLPPIIPSEGNGDPSLALAVPIEQFRDDYAFLVPDEYDENHVSIVAPANVTVTLDGADVSGQLTTFGSGSHKAGRVAVNPGAHKVACPGGCSIEVYGYSDAVSYLFAGGLDLEQIVID